MEEIVALIIYIFLFKTGCQIAYSENNMSSISHHYAKCKRCEPLAEVATVERPKSSAIMYV